MRFAFIAKHRSIWPVAWLYDALDVSRSGLHAWLNRSPSARALHDEALVTAIDRSVKSNDRAYGHSIRGYLSPVEFEEQAMLA